MLSPNNYIDYFRNLAVSHNGLNHNPASETGDAKSEQCHFARFSAEEVIQGLRSNVSFPALMVEMFEITNTAQTVYDVKSNYNGAFSVFASAKVDDINVQAEAYACTFKIMDDLLRKIWQDHYGVGKDRCHTPFSDFYFNTNITPVGPVFDKEYGWRCEFSFKPKNSVPYTTPPEDGVFKP